MNLSELRERTREVLAERATDRGLISDDAELDRWLNSANRSLFNEAVRWNPRPWIERTGDLAYTDPLPFSSLLAAPASVKSIHRVAAKDGEAYYALTPAEEGYLDDSDVDPGLPVQTASDLTKWYVEGEDLRLYPPAAVGTYLRVWLVRELADMVDEGDLPLGGRFADHHDLVVWKAAQLLFRKDEVFVTPWDRELEDGRRALRSALARNQGQQTRRIRRASHFP